jgi:hypothetical protein
VANPYTKAVRSVIRLIAACFIILSVLMCSADILFSRLENPPEHPTVVLVLKALPSVLGMVLYWKSEAIAKRLTQDLD